MRISAISFASGIMLSVVVACTPNPDLDLRTVEWIHGSPDCSENADAPIQVVQYNPSTWILRQSKCVHFEAPFMYLFLGNKKALLMDTGATEDSVSFPVQQKVHEIIQAWEKQNGTTVELVVAHSHSHDDHYAADRQFIKKKRTQVVGLFNQTVQDFFGFQSWPQNPVTFDLGKRDLILLPIPGHEESSIAVYDTQTHILLTGDSFYPGRLYIRDWPAFRSSINRLTQFCKTHPVKWLLGNHIEMKDSAGLDYPTGTTYQPNELPLPLSVAALNFLSAELNALGDVPTFKVFEKFILVPKSQPKEMSIESEAIHSLTIDGYPDFLAADGEDVWITNMDYVQKLSRASQEPIIETSVRGNCGAPVVAYGSLWVADCKEKSVVRIDASNGKIIATIPCGVADSEGELSLAAGANAIWILSDAKGILSRIDVDTNEVLEKIQVEANSFCAAFGFESVWITNTSASTVQRIDPLSNKVVTTIKVGTTPRFLAAGEGGVWTLNQQEGTVTVIDPDTNQVVATIDSKTPGTGGDIATGNGSVWVRAKNGRMLQSINSLTGKLEKIYGPLNGSGAVRVAGKNVWVTAHDVNKVWVIQ